MQLLTITASICGIASLYVAILVRKDTEELSKFTDKPIYYTISLFTNDQTKNAIVYDKYVSIPLTLIVDDFKIKNNNSIDINYNAVFTKIKYYMVYDYDINKQSYKYMRYRLDDKLESQIHYDDNYYIAPSKLNYSLTPNKKYAYILIYTETTSEKNLDLVFFNYNDKDKTFTLNTIFDTEGKEKIDISIIDYDTLICKDYFLNTWSKEVSDNKYDINFMFNVYNDLYQKLV